MTLIGEKTRNSQAQDIYKSKIMIRLGLLGIGRIGRIHLQHINRHFNDATVVAAMSPSEPGRTFAQHLGVPFVTDDAMAVIRHPEVDAVLICSPTNAHADPLS